MKTFKDLDFKKHVNFPNGTMAQLNFDNKYGVSVITGDGAYQSEGNYEVAVLYDDSLCYSTDITDDVLSYQSVEDINNIMENLQYRK